jgi:hypothetical protein
MSIKFAILVDGTITFLLVFLEKFQYYFATSHPEKIVPEMFGTYLIGNFIRNKFVSELFP